MIKPEGLKVGDPVHLDPRALPDLVIISADEAKAISAATPERRFTITHIGKNVPDPIPPLRDIRRTQ